MLRGLYTLASPAGARARLTVLIFHRVLPAPDPLLPGETDAARFDTVCGWLRRNCSVLPLDEAVRRLREGRLPARAAAISFDDGYADNHDAALPILQRHGLAATFFIATGFLDGGRMFNDSVIEAVRGCRATSLDLGGLGLAGIDRVSLDGIDARRTAIDRLLGALKYLDLDRRDAAVAQIAQAAAVELPRDLMMTSDKVRALHRAGMGIGAHTVLHPILAGLDAVHARREVADGKRRLETLIDTPVTLFAYPNGKPQRDYSAESVEIVRALGFDAAFSTAWGAAHARSDLFQLPRFTPWDRTPWRFGARMLRNLRETPATV